jgi:branched-chain amino acid aminotransferase
MKYRIYSQGKEVSGKLPFGLMRTEAVGIFESMRAYRGRILHEKNHLERLLESAKTVGYKPVPKLQKLRSELALALRTFQGDSPSKGVKGTVPFENLSVRLTLWEGKTFIIIGSRAHPKALYEKGVALKTASFPRGGPNALPWQVKASAYQQAILASTEPHPGKIYEWIFLDQQNFLTETRIGNFFLVKHPSETRSQKLRRPGLRRVGAATLLTPPEHGILNGVTRRFVIKCALEIGLHVQEVPLTRHDFFNADEAFLCNTSWEVLPVRELDGRVIGMGRPGPVTSKLHRFFSASNRGGPNSRSNLRRKPA